MCFSVGIERNLSHLSKLFSVSVDGKAFLELNQLVEKHPDRYKIPSDDNRLYPHIFGPVIKAAPGKSLGALTPMRYRVRPHDAYEEVPSKFNLFNARLDSLETRKTWRPLFGQNHGLFPFKRFYEWVEGDSGKKQLVSFNSKDHEFLMAPILYDYYKDEKGGFYSFAIITTDPPKEILAAGHDRCPIFLKEEHWQDWLNPTERSKEELYEMLKAPLETFYQVRGEDAPISKVSKKESDQLDLFKREE